MSEPGVEFALVGHRALAAVPIVVVDALAAWWLLRVARNRDGHRFLAASGAFDLGLFFASLSLLAIGQVLTCAVLDQRIAFVFNHGLQSAAVIMSAVPLVRFSHRLIAPMFPLESRISERVVLIVAAGASVVYFAFAFTPEPLFFDVLLEQSRLVPEIEAPRSLFLTGFLLVTYGYALVVLLRKARMLEASARRVAHSFAIIVLAAICAVIINRLESIELLPIGTYTTYMLWVTLAALLLFLVATDEITHFRDRIAALVVVGMLGAVSVAILGATDALGRSDDRQRAELFARVALAPEGLSAFGVKLLAEGEEPARIDGNDPRVAFITTVVVVDGRRLAVVTPYLEHRRVVDAYARQAAVLVVLSMILALLVVPRLAEWSVLRPLSRFVRAESESRDKSVFLAGMSHELRTPLTAISHHASLLVEQRAMSPDEVQTRAAEIEDAASHLLSLIETLLLAGRHDSVAHVAHFDDVALQSVVDAVLSNHRPLASKKGIELAAQIDVNIGLRVRTDVRVLRQILSNLVGNALKFTDQGSVRIVAAREGESDLRLTVVDTGRGIPSEAIAHVFEPFFQHDPKDGVGLGLSLVRTLVDAVGGRLVLESEVGRGTRVTVTLQNAIPGSFVVDDSVAPVAGAPALALPSEVREELLAFAKVGDIVRLRERVRSLGDSDCDAATLRLLDEHISRYQLRAVRTLLERIES